MTLCPLCGLTLYESALCPHHDYDRKDNWAESNKAMCDFFHRGVIQARPRQSDLVVWWEEE